MRAASPRGPLRRRRARAARLARRSSRRGGTTVGFLLLAGVPASIAAARSAWTAGVARDQDHFLHIEPREIAMCRNIRTLFNFEPPATEEEIRAASPAVRAEAERLQPAVAGQRSGLRTGRGRRRSRRARADGVAVHDGHAAGPRGRGGQGRASARGCASAGPRRGHRAVLGWPSGYRAVPRALRAVPRPCPRGEGSAPMALLAVIAPPAAIAVMCPARASRARRSGKHTTRGDGHALEEGLARRCAVLQAARRGNQGVRELAPGDPGGLVGRREPGGAQAPRPRPRRTAPRARATMGPTSSFAAARRDPPRRPRERPTNRPTHASNAARSRLLQRELRVGERGVAAASAVSRKYPTDARKSSSFVAKWR